MCLNVVVLKTRNKCVFFFLNTAEKKKIQQTFGSGSFGLHRAGNNSFNLSFSVLGLSGASDAKTGGKIIIPSFDKVRLAF